MRVFWEKGYAATSTDELLDAMSIGRQSLYNAFGDKRRIYLEALERYQAKTISRHIDNLNSPASPLAGLNALLLGLIPEKDSNDPQGCMGVHSICEFGGGDPELAAMRSQSAPVLGRHLLARIRDGQDAGELDAQMDANEAMAFVQMTMQGMQVASRAGVESKMLRSMAKFAVERLRAR
ncbi:MAG: TetR/AcrR family transcriptional regulator [Parvibaculaceae bacterium]|nr:TetR/AcrR family transcriptional regulator [Parvibaculaceae bacterium]